MPTFTDLWQLREKQAAPFVPLAGAKPPAPQTGGKPFKPMGPPIPGHIATPRQTSLGEHLPKYYGNRVDEAIAGGQQAMARRPKPIPYPKYRPEDVRAPVSVRYYPSSSEHLAAPGLSRVNGVSRRQTTTNPLSSAVGSMMGSMAPRFLKPQIETLVVMNDDYAKTGPRAAQSTLEHELSHEAFLQQDTKRRGGDLPGVWDVKPLQLQYRKDPKIGPVADVVTAKGFPDNFSVEVNDADGVQGLKDYYNYWATPVELDPRLAEIKRRYAQHTGTIVNSPETARQAYDWFRSGQALEHYPREDWTWEPGQAAILESQFEPQDFNDTILQRMQELVRNDTQQPRVKQASVLDLLKLVPRTLGGVQKLVESERVPQVASKVKDLHNVGKEIYWQAPSPYVLSPEWWGQQVGTVTDTISDIPEALYKALDWPGRPGSTSGWEKEGSERTATLIRGNPNVPPPEGVDPEAFYSRIRDIVTRAGYTPVMADSEPNTVPDPSDVWIGFSRGGGRLPYAPEGTMTIPIGSHREGAINNPEDDVHTPYHIVGGSPPAAHWEVTPEMENELLSRLLAKSAVTEVVRPRVENAASTVRDPETVSDAQREALNYKQGKIHMHGLRITIQASKGQRRKPEWSPLLAHYGHVLNVPARSRDGEHVDVFVGPDPDVETAFVADLQSPGGHFDESKIFLGFPTRKEAYAVYTATYPSVFRRSFSALSLPQLKEWLNNGDARRPVQDQIIFFKNASTGILVTHKGRFRRYTGPGTQGGE